MNNKDPVKGRIPTAPAAGQGDELPSPLTHHHLGAHPERGPPSVRARGLQGLSDTSDTQTLRDSGFWDFVPAEGEGTAVTATPPPAPSNQPHSAPPNQDSPACPPRAPCRAQSHGEQLPRRPRPRGRRGHHGRTGESPPHRSHLRPGRAVGRRYGLPAWPAGRRSARGCRGSAPGAAARSPWRRRR